MTDLAAEGNVMNDREKLLEQLTGVDSSKLNYYVELKKRNQEVLKQNSRLKILHQLAHNINIDMTIADIIEQAFAKLPQTLPCDFLGLVTVKRDGLKLKAMMPHDFCRIDRFPDDAPTATTIRMKRAAIFALAADELPHFRINPPYSGPLRSLVLAPMFKRTEVIGALIVGSSVIAAYEETDLSFVEHLADQLSISIQNARLYKQVSRAKEEWEATFMAVTDPIFLVDTDYNVLLHNGRLPVEMQPFWEQALERTCFARLYGRSSPCPDCPLQQVQRSRQPVYQRVQTETGLVLDLSYYPVLNEQGELSAVTIILKDVTTRIKMEGQLIQSAKLAALGEMAAGVAHELNSPLTVIIGTAQLLARELQQDGLSERAADLADIVNSGLRCKRIIQNLLTFSRQDQQPATATDLNSEVRLVLDMITYQINRSQITITEQLAADLPQLVVNGPQIQQVLTNFLINARDAVMEVERAQRRITVATELREEHGRRWAIVSVSDNGVGIPSENLARIFTPFYTSKEASKGTGLGLSVSLGIAESHNGTITVDSRAGQGSTFTLLLPVDQP